jgi:single-strand DNA-binding protein
MADLNKVFLIGRLTQDPELRYTPGGAAVSDLRLATGRTYTNKAGESKEDTLFIDVTVWNRQAENCCQYLRKGRQVHVEGFLKSESWETQAGEKRSKVKVEAERVQFLDPRDRDAGGGEAPSQAQDDYAPPRRSPGAGEGRPNGAGRSAAPAASARPVDTGDENEDIPF